MRHRNPRSQRGASLVIVLMFISVFGLIITALLTEASASIRYTTTVSDHEKKVYAADAGVAFGIQQVRQHNQLCSSAGVTSDIQTLTVNGREVSITCEGTEGSTLGALGYAIITTSPGAQSLDLQSGGGKIITGPVYIGGGVDNADWSDLTVHGGDVVQVAGTSSGSCSAGAPKPAGLVIDDPSNPDTPGPYKYTCTSAAPPNPPHDAPGPPPTKSLDFPLGHRLQEVKPAWPECTIWYPGLYETPPILTTSENYFASGVYYFNFTAGDDKDNDFSVDQSIYAGQPSLGEERTLEDATPPTPTPACALQDPDPTDAPEVTGAGVEFVFGSRARMDIQKVNVELFARSGGSGTSGISLIAVPNSASPTASDLTWTTGPSAGWSPNTLPGNDDKLTITNMHNGALPNLAIHGMTYAWDQWVRLWATNDVDAQVWGGVVGHRVELQMASGDGIAISTVAGKPEPRSVLIRASAAGTSAGERPVESTAIARIENNPVKPAKVLSWRTRGPSDPS